jgi:hypothetical protein
MCDGRLFWTDPGNRNHCHVCEPPPMPVVVRLLFVIVGDAASGFASQRLDGLAGRNLGKPFTIDHAGCPGVWAEDLGDQVARNGGMVLVRLDVPPGVAAMAWSGGDGVEVIRKFSRRKFL